MSNYGLQQALAEMDVPLIRANVGDRYVLQQLQRARRHAGRRDLRPHPVPGPRHHRRRHRRRAGGAGSAGACRARIWPQARQGLEKLPQVMLNVRADGAREGAGQRRGARRPLAEVERQLKGRGRVVLRASGTEPVVRVTVEAADAAEVQRLAERLAEVVKSAAERS